MDELLWHATTGNPRSPHAIAGEQMMDEVLQDLLMARVLEDKIEILEGRVDWWKKQADHLAVQLSEMMEMYTWATGRSTIEDYATWKAYIEEREMEERYDRE